MAKKPLQFHVSEDIRTEIEQWVKKEDLTLSEFLRQSVKLNMILKNYTNQGYSLILKKKEEDTEKEIILP